MADYRLKFTRLCIVGLVLSISACSTPNGINSYFGAKQKDKPIATYQADDYPAIKWDEPGVISPNQLSSVMNAKNVATLGVRDTLTGEKYKYIDEFTEAHDDVVLMHRIFQYRKHETSWLFRDLDMDGKRYDNYILVTSWTRNNGGCHHSIRKKGKTLESVYKYVYTKPDIVIEKSKQPLPQKSNGCQ